MKKKTLVIFISYIWTKTLLGLTFHPYQQIRQTVKRPILFPVIFSPLIMIGVLFIISKIGGFLLETHGIQRDMIAIFLSTAALSIIFWQLLLIYLLVSFLIVHWKQK
ncbi:MAG TPA: hypothetical protein VG935_01960 [Patescibacteria group bacterium]|nr:hypothetical protein [Patescibacteria group bacterium]